MSSYLLKIGFGPKKIMGFGIGVLLFLEDKKLNFLLETNRGEYIAGSKICKGTT